mgnify:CR=1 FL=1
MRALTVPMLAALRYAKKVSIVRAWPDDIADGTIRRLRRERYLDVYETIGPVNCCGIRVGYRIEDQLSRKGTARVAQDRARRA